MTEMDPEPISQGINDDFKDRIQKMAEDYSKKQSDDDKSRLIKSYIAVLTSALGGIDYSSNEKVPSYKLGHEALLCLKDIKKWLRSYDDQRNSWTVAEACAESGLVVNDLIVILCQWYDNVEKGVYKSVLEKEMNNKIALSCLELIVTLTWPLSLEGIYQDQLRYYSALKRHQLVYKKHILAYQEGKILKAIIMLGFPIIGKTKKERTGRDNAILRLCVTFFRNVLIIMPASRTKHKSRRLKGEDLVENFPNDVDPEDISLSTCLVTFHKNMVLTFILTITSSIGDEFDEKFFSEICLRIIFELIKSFKPVDPFSAAKGKAVQNDLPVSKLALKDLLTKENQMKLEMKKNGSSRHARFGTLLSLQTADQGRLTLSGQKGLSNQNPISQFDSRKGWHKSKLTRYQSDEEVVFPAAFLSKEASTVLTQFASDVLDGAFNTLIQANVRIFENDERVPNEFKIQFLLVISWFLEAERVRNEDKVDEIDYGLITSALEEKTFVLVFKYLEESIKERQWNLTHAAMICFKEIVKTANTMSISTKEFDQEVSTSIKEKIFHKQFYLDLLTQIPRFAFKHSPDFVTNCVDMVYIVLKVLEEYSKEDVTLYIQSKKKKRKTRPKEVTLEQQAIDELDDESDEELIKSKGDSLSAKRKFSYKKYQDQFIHQTVVSTYIAFFERYRDLSDKELKKGLQFLHMIFVTRKRHVILYRLDFMMLLYTLSSEEGLKKSSSVRKHVLQFTDYFMKKLTQNLESTPSLFVELLFPKLGKQDLKYFLEYGEFKPPNRKLLSVQNEVIIKGSEDLDDQRQVAIVIAALIDDDMRYLVDWISEVLNKVVIVRVAGEHFQKPLDQQFDDHLGQNVTPNHSKDFVVKINEKGIETALISNAKVRFVLKMAGFSLPSDSSQRCIFKASNDLELLKNVLDTIKIYSDQPVEFEEGKTANDYILYRPAHIHDTYYEYSDVNDEVWTASRGADLSDNDDRHQESNIGYNDDVLDALEDAIEQSSDGLIKGVAKSKRKRAKRAERARNSDSDDSDSDHFNTNPRSHKRLKRKRGPMLPMHDISDGEEEMTNKKERAAERSYISSKYVVSSDDESDEESNRIFFENEDRLRRALEENNGLLNAEQLKQFAEQLSDNLKNKDATRVEGITKQVHSSALNSDSESDNDIDGPIVEKVLETTPESNDFFFRRKLPKVRRVLFDDDDD